MASESVSATSPKRLSIPYSGRSMLITIELIVVAVLWYMAPDYAFPTPAEVVTAWRDLWFQGLGDHVIRSMMTNAEAILWSCAISLGLAYLTVLPKIGPIAEPIVSFVAKLRFLSLGCMTIFFARLFTGSPHELKVSLLVFSVVVFFVTGMADVLTSIPKEQYDLARTLRMNEWQIVWEVVVLGQIDKAFDVLRQNAAMSWMMLTMVEGIVFSEGGVGAVLQTQSHHFRLESIVAIQFTILGIGLVQDFFIGFIKNLLCPYASIALERR